MNKKILKKQKEVEVTTEASSTSRRKSAVRFKRLKKDGQMNKSASETAAENEEIKLRAKRQNGRGLVGKITDDNLGEGGERKKKRFNSLLKIRKNKADNSVSEIGDIAENEVEQPKAPPEPTVFGVLEKKLANFRNTKGRTVFEVEGLNFAKLISALSREVKINNVRTGDKRLRFSAPSKQAPKIIALLDNLCYNYQIIKVYGAAPASIGFLARFGLALGIAFSIIALAIYPKFVTKVEIEGELLTEARDILWEYGVREGKFLPKLDEKAVANELLALDGIAFASVERRGAHIYVTLKPELDDNGFVDISGDPVTAKKRATVTRVIVTGGTAEVKYGDVVKPGDLLIGNYVLSGEEKVETPAGGEVYGKAYHERKIFFPDTEYVTVRGAKKSYTRLGMFGKIPKTPKAPFGTCETELTVKKNGFFIPYIAYTWTFTEIRVEERANTRTEEQMKREAYSALLAALPAGAFATDGFSEIKRVSGGVEVRTVIETEELIS